MVELVIIFKLYSFVIYLVSIFLAYFTKCCRSTAWFYLQKTQNQLEATKSKTNSGGLYKYHMLTQASINVNWEIQHALQTKHILSNMLHKSVPGWTFQHVAIGSMRFPILSYEEELVVLLMDKDPGHF